MKEIVKSHSPDYPLTFEPGDHLAIWGRERWEVSVHPAAPSVIANGALKGRSLAEVMPDFPLLAKVIDAKSRLSVQVHPNEATCKITGGEPKTEMWVMLEDGVIYAGLKPGVTAADIADAVKSGAFGGLLARHEARKGECFLVPGGLVHSIGDNSLVYEVQQSSNTTFRLYDWNRVMADGVRRPLQIEPACRAIDYSLAIPQPVDKVDCDFFHFRKQAATAGEVLRDEKSPMTVFDPATRRSTLVPRGVDFTVPADSELFITTL